MPAESAAPEGVITRTFGIAASPRLQRSFSSPMRALTRARPIARWNWNAADSAHSCS